MFPTLIIAFLYILSFTVTLTALYIHTAYDLLFLPSFKTFFNFLNIFFLLHFKNYLELLLMLAFFFLFPGTCCLLEWLFSCTLEEYNWEPVMSAGVTNKLKPQKVAH